MSRALMALVVIALAALPAASGAEEAPKAAPEKNDAAAADVQIEVHGIASAPGSDAPAVILITLDKTKFLPIFVGENEAAAIWRPLAPSQDQLAADGLAFLQELLG